MSYTGAFQPFFVTFVAGLSILSLATTVVASGIALSAVGCVCTSKHIIVVYLVDNT